MCDIYCLYLWGKFDFKEFCNVFENHLLLVSVAFFISM
jgi:hypothetical protein